VVKFRRMGANKRTVFNLDWLSHDEWPWLERCGGDIHSARCSVCFKTFSMSNMRKQVVISHASSKGHLKNMHVAHPTPPAKALISCSQAPVQESSTSMAATSTSVDVPSTSSASGFSMSSYLLDSQFSRAEILYCLTKCANL